MKLARELVNPIQKKWKWMIYLLLFLVIAAGTFIMQKIGTEIQHRIETQASKQLTYICRLNARNVEASIDTRLRSLRVMADYLDDSYSADRLEELVDALSSLSSNYSFYSIGLFDKNGDGYTSRGVRSNVVGHEFFDRAIEGEDVITASGRSLNEQKNVNVFSIPVKRDGEIVAVLAAAYDSLVFRQEINSHFYDGQGQSFVLTEKGIVASHFVEEESDVAELVRYISDNQQIGPEAQSGTFLNFEFQEVKYIAFIMPLNVAGWSVLSYLPSSAFLTEVHTMQREVIFTLGLLYLCILLTAVLCTITYRGMAKRIVEAAFADNLTSAYNYEYLKLVYRNMAPGIREQHFLVLINVDKFRFINVFNGESYGDKLLLCIANTFRTLLPQDMIFRCDGDMFAAVVRKEKELVDYWMGQLDKGIHDAMGDDISFTISYGACQLSDGESFRQVYDNAIVAMRSAKRSNFEKFRFFDERAEHILAEQEMALSFDEALQKGHFKVWYQPKYDMRTRNICGAEALVRWQREDGSLVPPGHFIPMLENNGRIVDLDEEVLRSVCADIRQAQRDGLPIFPVSVNLSKVHLEKPDVLERIVDIVAKAGVEHSLIAFELTESAVTGNREHLIAVVSGLRARGFTVDIDDYGMGSSSLRTLASASFDTLKLDKSFIDQIGSEKGDIILKSTIELANKLGICIVAEGVETQEQADFLVANQCFVAQGYLFSRPLDRETYMEVLRRSANPPPAKNRGMEA